MFRSAAAYDRSTAMQQVKFRLSKYQARAATDQARNAGLGRPARTAYRRWQEYAWPCAPFTEGAQYGIEVFIMSFASAGKAASSFLTASSDRARRIAAT